MTGTRIFSVDQLLDVLDQVLGASARTSAPEFGPDFLNAALFTTG